MLRCLEVEFFSLSASCVAISLLCAAPFSSMCSTQSNTNSRKLRLRYGCQFLWCALALSVLPCFSRAMRLRYRNGPIAELSRERTGWDLRFSRLILRSYAPVCGYPLWVVTSCSLVSGCLLGCYDREGLSMKRTDFIFVHLLLPCQEDILNVIAE
jgi:hypothetical protein